MSSIRKLTTVTICLLLSVNLSHGFSLDLIYRLIFPSPVISNVTIEIPENCGHVLEDRIVGGMRSAPYAWPWMASLQTFSRRHFCGGTVISQRHILTAAHCMIFYKYVPSLLRVVIGSNRLGFGDTYFVDSAIVYPSYGKKSTYDSDLALLILSSNIQFHEGVNAICLPENKISPSKESTVLGWGHLKEGGVVVQTLRETTVMILEDKLCDRYSNLYLKDVMICAGWKSGITDACKGDSGGPLVSQTNAGKWEIHGIISFGKGCAKPGYPGVYTKVFYFKDWIKESLLLKD